MFAVIAAIIFILMAFGVNFADLGMLWLALAFLCLHLAFGTTVRIPWVVKREP